METAELKKELEDLLTEAESVNSLDSLRRGELKNRLMNLPDKGLYQAIEQLKDEKNKMAVAGRDIVKMGTEIKNRTRTLHALYLQEQRKGEKMESRESSEKILRQLQKKEGGEGVPWQRRMQWYFYVLAVAVLAALAFYLIKSFT